ncbi:MAG: hypothetical protein ACPGNT_01230, partial [Rhodospirillales bacterium]
KTAIDKGKKNVAKNLKRDGLHNAFKAIDADGGGSLSEGEVMAAIKAIIANDPKREPDEPDYLRLITGLRQGMH